MTLFLFGQQHEPLLEDALQCGPDLGAQLLGQVA
jgi:hypothetical protein